MKLGVYSYHAKGKMIGTIQLVDGQIVAPENIQGIVNSQLTRADGDAQKAFKALENWENGYLWIKPVKDENPTQQ